jgi:hypothetical protein
MKLSYKFKDVLGIHRINFLNTLQMVVTYYIKKMSVIAIIFTTNTIGAYS